MKEPDFFIVGAPNSKTAALYEYLSEHPQIFMCTAKDLNFFSADMPRLRLYDTEPGYRTLFENAVVTQLARKRFRD